MVIRKQINRLLVGLILILIMTFHLITNALINHIVNKTTIYFFIFQINIFYFYDLTIFILYGVVLTLLVMIE